MAKLDDVSDMIVGVTAGGSIDAIGDLAEIIIDTKIETSGEDNEGTTTISEEVEENMDIDAEIPAQEVEKPLPPPEPNEPDPPENSGGSPTGPGDYFGPDKRPIAF